MAGAELTCPAAVALKGVAIAQWNPLHSRAVSGRREHRLCLASRGGQSKPPNRPTVCGDDRVRRRSKPPNRPTVCEDDRVRGQSKPPNRPTVCGEMCGDWTRSAVPQAGRESHTPAALQSLEQSDPREETKPRGQPFRTTHEVRRGNEQGCGSHMSCVLRGGGAMNKAAALIGAVY
jgi:hypothetical protein